MSKVRVQIFTMSIDGFSAGPDQDMQNPIGVRGMELMEWLLATRCWGKMHGTGGGEAGVDDEIAERSFDGVGAFILGRNMFGPVRGPWLDDSWKGWWGEEPPYHAPVYVLTHHPRPSLPMAGGTTFHFISDGIHSALEQAKAAAGGKDIRIGGGVSTVRQYLQAGLVDDVHLVLRPILLGAGESLFRDLDLRSLGYTCTRSVAGERATHAYLSKAPSEDSEDSA